MIERLRGICVSKTATSATIDVQGVGYGVEMSERALIALPLGRELTVYVHTHVREDQLRLFGFPSVEERQMFNIFIGMEGLGPKLAMAILSAMDLGEIVAAAERDDAAPFEDVSGIGARTAKKIVIELKPKLEKLGAAGLLAAARTQQQLPQQPELQLEPQRVGATGLDKHLIEDLRSALENFGYKEKEYGAVLKRFAAKPPARDVPSLLRLALKELAL